MVSFFQSMSAMVARKSEGSLAVVVQNKKVRLEEKSRYRDQGDMILSSYNPLALASLLEKR